MPKEASRAGKLLSLGREASVIVRKHVGPASAVIVITAILMAMWVPQITESPIEYDDAQTLRMALNLYHHGVISLDTEPPYRPSMYREPIPPIAAATAVALVDVLAGPAAADSYFSGERARYLKYSNVPWLLLLSAAMFWATYACTSSRLLGVLAVALVNVNLPLLATGPEGLGADHLNTELTAASLLVLGSTLLSVGIANARSGLVVGAGIAFGALALTKAAFLFVFVGLLGALLVLHYSARRLPSSAASLKQIGLLALVFGLVVAPWMYRNYSHFSTAQIAERGGFILFTRALFNGMTADEYRGTFYAWAPERLAPVVGAALGFSPQDLERGGRLERLNDFFGREAEAENGQSFVSLYLQSRAERARLQEELGASGHPNPGSEADAILRQRALTLIADEPARHFAMTLPFLWRGAIASFPVLSLFLAVCLWRDRRELFLLVLPSFGLVLFYGLFSDSLPRYSNPVAPIVVVCGVWALQASWAQVGIWLRTGTLARATRLSGRPGA
jgi:hypothetical protein